MNTARRIARKLDLARRNILPDDADAHRPTYHSGLILRPRGKGSRQVVRINSACGSWRRPYTRPPIGKEERTKWRRRERRREKRRSQTALAQRGIKVAA